MFTFKTNKPTGRYHSFYPNTYEIKLNKISVGLIDSEFPYKIKFRIIKKDINEDGNKNCEWKWITLTRKNDSIYSAKEFLKNNYYKIIENFIFPKE